MEKVTINNEVVLMRKFVKQAKIRAINGYTKEIRKLQNRKGGDDTTSKFKRKAERLLQKVAILRKIHPDAVSRKALAKEKDWQAVLKQKSIPLEDQCYAMLANYAAVQSEVERFHKKYWDLVPKMPTFFKDWEEKSKDPMSKQEKKKAKEIRKNMKNIKLDKNNSNAVPIGTNSDTDAMKNISTNKNEVTNANALKKSMVADHKQIKNEVDRSHSKVMPSTVVENHYVIKEEISDESSKQSKVVSGFQNKSHLQVKNKQMKPAGIFLNKEEKLKGKGWSFGKVDSSEIEREDEVNSDDEEHSYEEGEHSNEELNSEEEEQNSVEEEQNSEEEEQNSEEEEEQNSEEELNSEEEEHSDEEVKSTEQNKSGKEKLNNRLSIFKFRKSTEMKNNRDLKMSWENNEDSDSENSNTEENEADSESDNAMENEATIAVNKKSNVPKSNANTSTNNSQDIRSRLQVLADNKSKSDTKRKRTKKTNSSKLGQENKAKAVAMINLNELLGLDEFPVEKAEDAVEETGETKSRKDPFFLGKNGEVISESEDEDSPNPFPAKDRPAFKKKKFDDHSTNGDSFKKKNFSANSSQNSRSGFKGKDFPRNKRDFGEGDSSFKNRAQRRADLKNKGFQNKSFGERMPSKQFKPNVYTEPRNRDTFPKNKTDKPSNKNPVDDKPLHPSWEAKKKLKEIATSKFQGKRIVFND